MAREVGTEGQLGGQAAGARAWRAPGGTSPTRSTSWPATSPPRCAPSPRWPPRWPRATCRRRSPSTRAARSWSSRTPSTRWSTSCPSFADEVTRVAREVGTEGRLGGQADVKGVSGTWKDLTESVNVMADNLTAQVRSIAEVTTAVAKGDLTAEDPRGRARRDPGAEGDHQHDGRPAVRVRRRGDPGGPRGRHRGQPRRPGHGARRVGHLEGPHRQRQRHGLQPDRPGALASPRSPPRWPRATCRRRSPSRRRARSPRSPRPSTRWSTRCPRSPTR